MKTLKMMMKNVRDRLKISLIAGMILVVVSCAQTDMRHEIDMHAAGKAMPYIEFGNYVNTMSRASMHVGKGSFTVGDTMAVWGEQTTGDIVDVIFNNQDVRYTDDGSWTYDNKKLWNVGSTYKFYGFFPYSKTLYKMSDDAKRYISIDEYTTPNDPAQQIDLMISERREVDPLNVVDMFFHHILSDVNVYVKVSNALEVNSIDSIVLKRIKLHNIMSTGRYRQTGWNNDRAVGSWDNVRNYMDIPELTDITINQTAKALYNDYLMIPQKLFSTDSRPKDITVDAAFRIVYKDGTSSTYIKDGMRLAGITGHNGSTSHVLTSWEPNYKYNYTLVFNPQRATRTWDADGDAGIQIDPVTGDTIATDDDTPTPGTMRYNPDEPDIIYIYEDTDDDDDLIPNAWVPYPIVWEDIDGDGLLEGGLDRDGDGHIDNVDGDTETRKQDSDPDKDPSDNDPDNPEGKDVILVHVDTDGDGDIDDDDEWRQLQKDPDSGVIQPIREEDDAAIEFTATVQEWEQTYTVEYNINQ